MSFLSRAYGMTGVTSGHMDAAHLVFFFFFFFFFLSVGRAEETTWVQTKLIMLFGSI